MTEQKFSYKIEKAATNFEQHVEAVADHLDKTVNHTWDCSRLFRCISRGASLGTEVGLLLAAGCLVERGHHTAATWCARLGVVGLIADILTAICFRRKSK